MKQGKIAQVIGPVVDVAFDGDYLPRIKEALTVEVQGRTLVMEVARHMAGHMVRCILLDGAEGLARDMTVTATGDSITVPVGDITLGRMFNVLGEPIDDGPEIPADTQRWGIHRSAPSFADQSPAVQILETGIKVIDLLCPYAKGGKIGLFGGAGVGKTVLLHLHRRGRAHPGGQRSVDRNDRVRRH